MADALPASVVAKLKQERENWIAAQDFKKLSAEERQEYFQLFSQRYEELLHADSGNRVLRDTENHRIVDHALHHFEGTRYELDEYIIMPNHVHVLVKPYAGHSLVEILHSWKSFTANKINQQLDVSGQLWQHES